MVEIDESFFDKLNPETVILYTSIKINNTTKINYFDIDKLAYKNLSRDNNANSYILTKINSISNLKRSIYIIGLLKRELNKDNSLLAKISLQYKLLSTLYKINDFINKYNITFKNLKILLMNMMIY
jgi:hypothetical protein